MTTFVSKSTERRYTRFVDKKDMSHKMGQTPMYKRRSNMLSRCYNPNTPQYQYYGALGVQVCDRWRASFIDFLMDMGGDPPTPDMQIDRIDPYGDYEPSNCRWATRSQQMKNKRKRISH